MLFYLENELTVWNDKLKENLREENWVEVVNICDMIIKRAPDDFETYIVKGNAHMEIQDYHSATEAFSKALDNNYSNGSTNHWKKKLNRCLQIINLDGNKYRTVS